ncbi:hypothetical protein WJX84_001370 [Apatococcus fuscideae]|uniref:Uncharacterized protein n=1 Tax=Apatococcus fuscideae TaxID=2026836 RepID=A0AAW1TE37_9CHLO
MDETSYPSVMGQDVGHEDENKGLDMPPGFSTLHSEAKQQASQLLTVGSFLRGAASTSLPPIDQAKPEKHAQHMTSEQLTPPSTQQIDGTSERADFPSASTGEQVEETAEMSKSQGSSEGRLKPQEKGANTNRAPLLEKYPTRAGKAEFDYCSVRVQPFPDRFSRDDIHDICFKFGREIGAVQAVWSGLGTRSGRPYGTAPITILPSLP